ncbi:hypothetical protein SORBI_3008G144701 [Sorghum bicolor]|uniref:DUF7880 domain-containing protein n=1 Tax=Sorghum bicolor TaxID=4558 RepID=A0A1Z5R6T4_SORBI|nr:hypothetical protein SORBI_3008G144701 [Sorghum bicolor]
MPKPSTSASASASTSTSTCAAPRRPPKPQPSAFPESVLLDTVVYMGRCRGNETTARAETSDGYPIEVSFLVADPPALARCFIYCPVLTVDDFFEAAPEIMAADGAFLLIRAIFRRRSSLDLGISPTISSTDPPCGTFNSASLSLANSCSPDEKIWDYKKKKLAINSVVSSFPTLDMCSNDVVYMLAKVKHTDPNGWVLSINTRSKKLQKIAPFSGDSPLISCIFLQCGFSKHLSSAPGACTTNGCKDDIKEDLIPFVPFVTLNLLIQQKLRQLEKYFTHERPSFDEVKTLIRTGVASFMNVHIHQVTQFATKNGLGKAAFEAVSTFERASKDIENLLSQRCRNVPSTRAKAVREKIHVAVEALDKLLNMLPSSLLDTGRSMVSVGCMDNESVVEGSISHNICIPEPYGLVY